VCVLSLILLLACSYVYCDLRACVCTVTCVLSLQAYLNERKGDPDLISPLELRLFGNGRSFLSKLMWLTFSQISQGLRPLQFKPITSPRYYKLLAVNAVHNIFYGCLAYLISGSSYSAVAYLLFSSLVSIGPHLVGIRWIAEHFQYVVGLLACLFVCFLPCVCGCVLPFILCLVS
jgi:hypothetical protein